MSKLRPTDLGSKISLMEQEWNQNEAQKHRDGNTDGNKQYENMPISKQIKQMVPTQRKTIIGTKEHKWTTKTQIVSSNQH